MTKEKTKIDGPNGISCTVIADSITEAGIRLTTLELVYHRYAHAELLTHRALSKNSSSSRAVPLNKAIQQVKDFPAIPVHWGKKQSGMQAKEELSGDQLTDAVGEWRLAIKDAVETCAALDVIGGHKQWASRPLEPFQMMKVVVTATDWNNFLWLRDHEDALPEIRELAKCIQVAMDTSVPEVLLEGEWHVPYVDTAYNEYGIRSYYTDTGAMIGAQDALKLSASCCAQVSYRNTNTNMEKAEEIFGRLLEGSRVHASPTEHQGSPISPDVKFMNIMAWPEGVTHIRRDGATYSGNLRGWFQYRQFIPNHCKFD
jgi:hypothetical protein